MRALSIALGTSLIIFVAGVGVSATSDTIGLKPVTDFSTIIDRKQRAIALFTEAGKVILNPRCMNCHPAGDRPRR